MEYDQNEPFWEGHRKRLRERVDQQGWDALKPHEMVEMILFYADSRRDMSDLARQLVNHFGSLNAVLNAPEAALAAFPGMTENMAQWVAVTGDLVRAYRGARAADRLRMQCLKDVTAFIDCRWPGESDLKSRIFYIDFEGSLITYCEVCESLDWWLPENVHQMVHDCVALQASRAILALFVGDRPLEPELASPGRMADVAVTLSAVRVDLVDCVLVGSRGYYSLNANGDMEAVRCAKEQMQFNEDYLADAGRGIIPPSIKRKIRDMRQE